jgi:hypothetical protein
MAVDKGAASSTSHPRAWPLAIQLPSDGGIRAAGVKVSSAVGIFLITHRPVKVKRCS